MRRQSFRGRRGQQAMEYMVTYGWAFVVIIVTIGAFAYFGLLNPEKYLPNRCDFGMQLKCVDYLLEDTRPSPGTISFTFHNSFGEDIVITDIKTAEGFGTFSGGSVDIADGTANDGTPIVLDLSGQTDHFLVKKDKILIPIVVTFERDVAGAPSHTVVGEVFATVQ